MTIGERSKRNRGFAVALGFVPSAVVAGLAAVAGRWVGEENGLLIFAVVLVAIHVVELLRWVVSSLLSWILFQLLERKRMATRFALGFRLNGYPEPEDYVLSLESYLLNVIGNESLAFKVRLAAAEDQSTLRALTTVDRLQRYLQIKMALEDALIIHKDHCAQGCGK